MTIHTVGLYFAIVSGVFYAWVLVMMRRIRKAPQLPGSDNIESLPASVTVVIAGRNEASSLAGCLQSILIQEGVEQVIFVDDHSTDGTLDVAKNAASNDKSLLVLSAPPLPDGWIGKSHAIQYGARFVRSRYLLFTDADVLLSPGTVKAAVAKMEQEQLDHLGGYFFIHCARVSEEICAPVLAISSGIALFRSAPTLGAATGAFNMLRTDFYKNIGGHHSIKNKTVDDVALARYAKQAGGKTDFVHVSTAVKVRLFVGFRGFMDVVARSAVPFLRLGKVVVLCCAMTLMLLGLATVFVSCFAVKTLLIDPPNSGLSTATWVVSVAAAYVLGLACIHQARRYHDGRMGWGLLYPLPIVLMALSTAWATVSSLLDRKVCWRGRSYERT